MKQITFRLKPGQLLKEEIEKISREKSIKAGVLVSIVAGLENAVLRMAGAEPGKEIVKNFDGPFEIIAGTGTISSEGCHIHIAISDKDGNVFGGHLRDGCIIRKTAEIVLLAFEDVRYKKVFDEETGYKELSVENNS